MTVRRQVDTTGVRQRNRPPQKVEPKPTKEIKDAAEVMYDGNKAKNAGATVERRGKKDLEHLMAKASEGSAWRFQHTFTPRIGKAGKDGAIPEVTLEATYEQPEGEYMDVHVLYEEVVVKGKDLQTFLRAVSASRTAVEKEAGKNIANLCAKTKKGEFSAKVKVLK